MLARGYITTVVTMVVVIMCIIIIIISVIICRIITRIKVFQAVCINFKTTRLLHVVISRVSIPMAVVATTAHGRRGPDGVVHGAMVWWTEGRGPATRDVAAVHVVAGAGPGLRFDGDPDIVN